MGWRTFHESEQLTIIVDDDKQIAFLEASSGGYRRRYVTLQWNQQQLQEVIQALQLAQSALEASAAP